MFKNYLKVAYVNIVSNKAFSLINVGGLAMGISLCLVLITLIKDQLNFDTFHKNADKIYRVNTEAIRKNGDAEQYASAPFPLGTLLKNNYATVKKVVRLTSGLNGEGVCENKRVNVNGFFTDPDFFEVFGFELLYGNSETALLEPNGILLTEKTSLKFFGSKNPVGNEFKIEGLDKFKVTGVIKTPYGKTHLEFDLLGSNSTLLSYEKEGKVGPTTSSWRDYYSSYIYVLLSNSNDAKNLQAELDKVPKKFYSGLELESRDKEYKFYFQPLNKIVPGPMLSNNMGKGLPSIILYFLSVVAFIIIASAGFNYGSLSLARALSRAKEIGIRKAAGAMRHQLVMQFLTESLMITVLAFLFACVLFHFFLRQIFEGFSVFKELDIVLAEDISLYFFFGLFCLIIGLVSGFVPALYLSSLKPSKALGDLKTKIWLPKMGFRKALLIFQFSIALVFTITVVNLYRQVNFLRNADYGFESKNIVNIELQNNDYSRTITAFSKNKNVMGISGISHELGTYQDRSVDVRINKSDEKSLVRDYSIDENYIENLKLQFVSGKNFSPSLPKNRELFVIVNETFVERFQLGNPAAALNKPVLLGDSIYVNILGVVKDFHYKPFTYKMEPLLLRYIPADISQLNVRISGINTNAVIKDLKATWESIDRTHPFSYKFFSHSLNDNYQSFNDLLNLLTIVAIMALTISCLGLLGLVIFLAKQKIKEIGIRRLLGANIFQIAVLFSGNFVRLLVFSCLIALPVSILVNGAIMNKFAYRINPISGYIIGMVLVLGITLVTVATEIWYSASRNPVKTLRTE